MTFSVKRLFLGGAARNGSVGYEVGYDVGVPELLEPPPVAQPLHAMEAITQAKPLITQTKINHRRQKCGSSLKAFIKIIGLKPRPSGRLWFVVTGRRV